MKTAAIQKVSITFKCINCRAIVTEKMHPVHAVYVKQAGGCCDGCCKIADDYFTNADYIEFEQSENQC